MVPLARVTPVINSPTLVEFASRAKTHWYDERGKVISAIAMGWLLSIGVRLTYPVMIPHLRDAYGLGLTGAGILLTVLWVAYALCQLPSGVLADWIGAGWVMILSTFIAAMTLTLVVIGGSISTLYISTAMFGAGTALYAVARYSVLSDIYPDRLGTAVGLTSAAGDVGNTILPPIASFLAAVLMWQVGFGFTIPIFILVGFGLWITVPKRTEAEKNRDSVVSKKRLLKVLEALRQPAIVLVTLIQALGTSVWQAFTGFYPTYLIEIKGMSSGVASGLFALFFAIGIIIKPLAGNSYDQIGAQWTLLIVIGISAMGIAFLPFVSSLWSLIVVTILVSLLLGRGTVSLSYMTDTLSDDVQNTGFGSLRTIYMLVGAASPVLIGSIADRGYFDEAFLLLAAISGVTALLAIKLPKQ